MIISDEMKKEYKILARNDLIFKYELVIIISDRNLTYNNNIKNRGHTKMEEKNTNEGFSAKEEGTNTNSGGGDVSQIRLFGILGYIFPILFFLPLITDAKDNSFAKYHANQQLILLLFYAVGYTAASILTVILIGLILYPIVMIFGLVCMILGIMNVVNDREKPLPLIGNITTLIK